MKTLSYILFGVFLSTFSFANSNRTQFTDDLIVNYQKQILDCQFCTNTVSAIFNTNIDWHSSVHAHWAVFRLARYTDDYQDFALKVAERFSPKNLEQEYELKDSLYD